MFHRFGGKTFFYVIVLLFFLVSVQNTWQFLVTVLPDSTQFFLGAMMIVFEGGFLGWLALLMHGTENIPRTIIAALMLVVSGVGVGTAAYYEFQGQMHKSIAVKIDPGFLANVPTIVNGVYLATFVAILLYILSSPAFFARMKHMNDHGIPPQAPRREVTGHLVSLPQSANLPQQPQTTVQPVANTQQLGWRQKLGNAISGNQQQIAAPTDTLWDAYSRVAESDREAREASEASTRQQAQPDVKAIVAAQKAHDVQQMAQLSPDKQASYYDDLAQSVGGNSAPFTAAPSPNGAKLNGQK